MQTNGIESKTPIELAIVNNVPGVIGAVCGFIPSIVVPIVEMSNGSSSSLVGQSRGYLHMV